MECFTFPQCFQFTRAQFLLTELAHGLDAKHLETTATLLPSGEYDLHTPRLEASKYVLSLVLSILSVNDCCIALDICLRLVWWKAWIA